MLSKGCCDQAYKQTAGWAWNLQRGVQGTVRRTSQEATLQSRRTSQEATLQSRTEATLQSRTEAGAVFEVKKSGQEVLSWRSGSESN